MTSWFAQGSLLSLLFVIMVLAPMGGQLEQQKGVYVGVRA